MAGRGPLLLLLLLPLVPSVQAAAPLDWPQQMAGVTAAGRDGTGIVVAVLDSGIDHTHPELQGRFWTNPADPKDGLDNDLNGLPDDSDGWDYCNDQPVRQVPGFAHGTMVAGVVAGSGTAGGVRGAAPGARIMDIQVYCDDNDYPTMDERTGRDSLRDGLAYAIAHDADVIVLSLQLWRDQGEGTLPGLLHTVMPVPEEFQAAYDAGIVVVGAAGNFAEPTPDQPGASPHVITVGATTGCGFRHGDSNHGPGIDLWVPGRTYATTLGASHQWVHGTSFAAPLVAGAAALLLESEPGLGPDEVLRRMLDTARPTEDGPMLDGHALFVAEAPKGRATLSNDDPAGVGGPYALQFTSHGDQPALLEVGAQGYGRYCFNLADPDDLDYVIAPARGETLHVAARALGATWDGPWLNRSFTFRPDGPVQPARPVLVHAGEAPSADGRVAPAPTGAIVALSMLALALARRR